MFVRFSQEFIFLLDLKRWTHLKLSTRAKIFFHFYLLIVYLPYVLPVNTHPLLYQTASVAHIFFFAASTNNDVNKVSALAIKITFEKIRFINSLNKWEEALNKYVQQTQFFPQELWWNIFSTSMNEKRTMLDIR